MDLHQPPVVDVWIWGTPTTGTYVTGNYSSPWLWHRPAHTYPDRDLLALPELVTRENSLDARNLRRITTPIGQTYQTVDAFDTLTVDVRVRTNKTSHVRIYYNTSRPAAWNDGTEIARTSRTGPGDIRVQGTRRTVPAGAYVWAVVRGSENVTVSKFRVSVTGDFSGRTETHPGAIWIDPSTFMPATGRYDDPVGSTYWGF